MHSRSLLLFQIGEEERVGFRAPFPQFLSYVLPQLAGTAGRAGLEMGGRGVIIGSSLTGSIRLSYFSSGDMPTFLCIFPGACHLSCHVGGSRHRISPCLPRVMNTVCTVWCTDLHLHGSAYFSHNDSIMSAQKGGEGWGRGFGQLRTPCV